MLFTVPSNGGFYRKPYSTMVLKMHTKKSAKKENLSINMNSLFLEREWKTREKLVSEKT
jgi:hypothetical protein